MKKNLLIIVGVTVLLSFACRADQEKAINTTVCEVVANPAAFNHKLIKLTGDVTHGFKQLTIAAGGCKPYLSAIWLEYGGLIKAPSVYDTKDIDGVRSGPLSVEGLRTTLVNDAAFRKFDKMIAEWSYNAHANITIIGRYFSGHQDQSSGFESWHGYGHQGCCSLLVIQQIIENKNDVHK